MAVRRTVRRDLKHHPTGGRFVLNLADPEDNAAERSMIAKRRCVSNWALKHPAPINTQWKCHDPRTCP
jgi:hypothetical protein